MIANELNQQTISFSGQSYKSLQFTGINRIDAYFHESDGAAAWNSDLYLRPSYSINSSTVVSFSFADSNALFNLDFFALLNHWIPYKPISYTGSQKVDIRKEFRVRAVASSFLASAKFKERYGEDVSNESYVNTLYVNVLGRDYDQAGYEYWLSNLNNGVETKYELLLGFSESLENKALFSEMTGLY